LARGRDFTDNDNSSSPLVGIVSEDFARRAWPDANPIGQRVSVNGPKGPFLTVVGVAREALTMGLSERRRPIVYTAQRQGGSVVSDLTLLVHSTSDASQLAAPIRRLVRSMDANLPLYAVQTLAQYRRDRGSESRLGSTLLAIFGGLALVLATVGVYAVMAFTVSQRTREIGVRVALGAATRQIVSLFVGEGTRLAVIGIAVGIVLAAAAAKLLASLFLGLTVTDVVPFVAVAVLLTGSVLLASWIPARRAARVDPMTALRAD
jgi:ABC-type antimicrobial peptide transport system permease subunit